MDRVIPPLRRLLLRRRTRYSLLIALVILAAIAVAFVLRKAAPPEAARLLPESDAILYFDLKPLRTATHFDKDWAQNPVQHEIEYQQFLDATGIVPERDVDDAAFALHRMANPNGPNGPVGYSEVFEGRFDATRLSKYLASIAIEKESYAGHDIYTIVTEGPTKTTPARLLRIAQLGYDAVAASNMPTTEQIHSILDRYRASASPFSGSSLLNARYRDVPVLSSAWAIGHIGLPFSENGHISAFGVRLPLPEDATFVASLRYVGTLHLRIEEITTSEADAQKSSQSLKAILDITKSIGDTQFATATGKTETDLKKFLDSLAIDQKNERVVLTGTVPLNVLRDAASDSTK